MYNREASTKIENFMIPEVAVLTQGRVKLGTVYSVYV